MKKTFLVAACCVVSLSGVGISNLEGRMSGGAPTHDPIHDIRHSTYVQVGEKHDRAFWKEIVAKDGAVPPGLSADQLSGELSDMLGDKDPELRDDIAYTVLTTWLALKPVISDAQAQRLIDRWVGNLQASMPPGDSTVILKSFSALTLASAIARENNRPFMGEQRYRTVLRAATAFFEGERDTRGFDPTLGWVHATAHTSDLLKFLARNRYLTPADQQALLETIARKVTSTTSPWTAGEDERIGYVVLAVVSRADFEWEPFRKFVDDVAKTSQFPERPAPDTLARYQNARHLLTSSCALLDVANQTPSVARAQKQIVAALSRR